MKVVSYPDSGLRTVADAAAVTIGAFDGVHLGHQAVIEETRERAARLGCASVVVTFDRHPASIVRPESAPRLLTTLDQKLELLQGTGVDVVFVVCFDEERARESAEDFVNEVLVKRLNARAVVVGHDFHFGHGRRGDVPLLSGMGREHGFDVIGLRLTAAEGEEPISSTRIRKLVSSGEVEAAARMLGRPHEVRGAVVEGDKRGSRLGYPTANIEVPPDVQLPADGVYAGAYVRPDGSEHLAAINLGRRPTFIDNAQSSLLEAHVLDFEGDLYGEPAAVQFTRRLRDEVKFDSAEALVTQVALDIEDVRRVTT